ncbi:hypothetical protein AB0M43_27680 [Longispora sp. NPDC051575]|uniref:hypothetical protein n=1 Tax=Longispora sp. NPDC051575 TaxID=3154943 RepID=UPI0034295AF8
MTVSQAPLLREFIDIPEHTSDSDLVLQLAQGVSDPDAALRDYVITNRLHKNFDEALQVISSSVAAGEAKAAYLHGSFGAGKSHFMAVLHALLEGREAARKREEFAPLLQKYDSTLRDKKFLLVPYYMMGAKSIEQKVLGGYLRLVQEKFPDAVLPAVHRNDALFKQAAEIRARVGDEQFLAAMPGENDWGDTAWTTEALDSALAAKHDSEERNRLADALTKSPWGSSFLAYAAENADSFISLDEGLTVIAEHAKGLGFDGLILFLDELLLWLANHSGDPAFVASQLHKITNFVESGNASRPLPIISFIARQRDLRDFFSDAMTGGNDQRIQQTLDLAKARFDIITLEDQNLPEITRQRLLKPVSPEAAARIDEAFTRTNNLRPAVKDVLLGSDKGVASTVDDFRAAYPFTPAFLSTLVYVAGALQRTRTGLKLMRSLLVKRRDDLRLGEIIPLGDLYTVLTDGDDRPFTTQLKDQFNAADKLYRDHLKPHLRDEYDLTDDEIEGARHGRVSDDPATQGRIRAFMGDDRLIKTLLLQALAPNVPALYGLTASRLAALNHGSIVDPTKQMATRIVADKVEAWASKFPEIRFVEGDDPGVSLELAGVDVESVLTNVPPSAHDPGEQKAIVKRLLWAELGITPTEAYEDEKTIVWRGSSRKVGVLFRNVRDQADLRDDEFAPLVETGWRLIIDYPFDEGTIGPVEDRNRVEALRTTRPSNTVCWVPAQLSNQRRADLRRLARIEYAVNDKRYATLASHLNRDDREQAKVMLERQAETLRQRLRGVLRAAYGLAEKKTNDISGVYDDHVLTLRTGLSPTLPQAAKFPDALKSIVHQVLGWQYPDHPNLDTSGGRELPVKPGDAATVLRYAREAIVNGRRVIIENKDQSTVKTLAEGLKLGEMPLEALVLGDYWIQHFRGLGLGAELQVSDLLHELGPRSRRGLDPLMANLVVVTFAEQHNYSFHTHGARTDVAQVDAVRPEMVLRLLPLPNAGHWATAGDRAAKLFGINQPPVLSARLVSSFVRELSQKAAELRHSTHPLLLQLEVHKTHLGLDHGEGRLHTAQAAVDLLDGLGSRNSEIDVIEHFAQTDLGCPPEWLAKSMSSAPGLITAMESMDWNALDLIVGAPGSDAIFDRLRAAARADEKVTQLVPALHKARDEARALARSLVKTTPPPPVDPLPPLPPVPPGVVVTEGSRAVDAAGLSAVLDELRAIAEEKPGARFDITWRVQS